MNRTIGYLLTLGLVIFTVFSPCLKAGFLNWDDDKHVLNNPHVTRSSIANTVDIFTGDINRTYLPLTILTFNLEHRIFGLNPFVYHFNNILLHVLACIVIFFLAQQLGLPPWAAFLTGLTFGIHPMHVESVAWITGRKDVLYTLFYLLSIFFYLRYRQHSSPRAYGISVVMGLLSVLSKSMAMSLPWILFVFDALQARRWDKKILVDKIPFFLVVEPVAWITYAMNSRTVPMTWPDSFLLWIWSATFYPEKFFLPLDLNPLYRAPQPIGWANPVYLKALVIGIVVAGLVVIFRRQRWWMTAILFYIGSAFFLWR